MQVEAQNNTDNSALLTIVVPFYNEAENIPEFLPLLVNYCQERNWNLFLVDDGSSDSTLALLKQFADGEAVQVFGHGRNMGYGAAIKTGLARVRTPFVVTIDGDGQHKLEDIDVLLESAYFNPGVIRKGARFLGMQTEASYRFERGTDYEGLLYALNRLAALIVEVAGGQICRGIVDNYPNPIKARRVVLRYERTNRLIGMNFEPDWIKKVLTGLGCEIINSDESEITVTVPTWRPDLEREVDLIEEIAVSYTHLRAHETPEHLVCRPLLEKKKQITTTITRFNPVISHLTSHNDCILFKPHNSH